MSRIAPAIVGGNTVVAITSEKHPLAGITLGEVFETSDVPGGVVNLLSGINNATTDALNRWSPTNTNTDVPKAQAGRTRRVSTRWIQDGSYIRIVVGNRVEVV